MKYDMDALEDILRVMRLSSAVFLDAEFTAPWSIIAKVDPEDCRPFMPAEAAHLIAYHYVVEGKLAVGIDGEPPVETEAGDLLVLPRNDTHILASDLALRPVKTQSLIEPGGPDGVAHIRHGGGGAKCRILCGFLGSRDRTDPLIASLPPLLKLPLDAAGMGSWVEGSMRYAARELASAGPGCVSSLSRLSELLFGEAVRVYLKSLPRGSEGWLAGLRDPYVGRALASIHSELNRPWTLNELAREAGLSRSALGERFRRRIGQSPMRYIGRRRLEQAADRLRHEGASVSEIAYDVGYGSEAAFSKSFKREFGCSPAAFRDAAQSD